MASYYFVIKQRTSASSTYTGDTYYVQWDTGLSGATDDSNLQLFTGGTYTYFNNFKHRYWSVTYDGTTPNQSVDYTMKNDDYHGGSSVGFPPTGMEVSTFSLVNLYRQNNLLGLNGDVYFSDTNYVIDDRRNRIDSSGNTYETGWVFGSASSSEFWNWLGGNLTLFDVANTDQNPCGGYDIPFSATGAISYYNTNGDGYTYQLTDEESTCNIDVTTISVDGDALDKDTAYLTNYNACFTPGNICFRPYTGNSGNTIVTAYDSCAACTGGTGNDVLYYSAASCCDESVYVFTADTLNGNIRGSLGAQSNTGLTINGECVGSYTQITTGYTITGTIDGYYTPSGEVMCNSCTGETPCLDYYYFEPCNGDDLYRTRQGDYDTAFGGPPISGNVYKIENISDIPDGCYTNVTATATTVTFNGYGPGSQSTEIPGGCSDLLCSASTPTPTPSISETSTPTPTPSISETSTPTPTPTPSISETSTPTPTNTASVTPTHTVTQTPSNTPGGTPPVTPSLTPSITPSISETETPTPTPTITPTVTTSSSSNDYQFEDCCGGYFIFSGYTGTTNIVIGQTYNYNFDGTNGVCATAVTYSGSGPSYVYSGVGNPVLATGCEDGECPPCDSPTPTPSVTPTNTPTYTPSPTVTTSNTPGSSSTPTPTVSDTPDVTPTYTPTYTPSETPGGTPTQTPTPTIPCNRLVNPSFDIFMSDLGPCPDACTGSTTGGGSTADGTNCTSATTFNFYPEDCIPGWETTDSGGKIEIWASGYQSVPAYQGSHFAEINAESSAAQSLYQTFTVVSGTSYQVQFAHRGRTGFLNTLRVGLSGATSGLNFFPGEYTGLTGSWTLNAINFTATETDYNLVFSATSAQAGGNFLDAIDVVCPQDFVTQTPTPTQSQTPTPTYTPTYTPSVTPSITPSPSDSGDCVEGVTDGTYHYTDCCGFYRSGQSVGEIVPFDPSQPYSGISLNGTSTTQNCDQGDLDYNFSVTGTCEDANGGVITIAPFAGVPPYTIDNILPGTLTGGTSNQPFTWTGLTAGTYTFRLNDSLGDSNNEIYVNVNIDGCILTDIDFSGTTCGSENGYIKVSGDSTSLPYQIVLYRDGLVYSNTSSPINPTEFFNLPNGEYYATIEDYGGATGQTSTVTLSGVSSLDYGLSVTGTSSCGVNTGAIEITGLTGSSPYTYLWSNGATGDTISNLSGGTYSVTVTDSNNCELIKSATVNVANGISLLSYTTTPTSCLSEDGQVTVYISGGTSPYTYQGQNGHSGTTSDTTFTFTGCSSGNFEFTITDSSNCTFTDNVNIGDLGGITSVNTRLDYVNCGSLGNVTITVVGDGGPYTYSYTGQTSGGTQSVTTSNTQQQFTNLISDTYDYKVEGSNGCCYTGEFTVSATPKFELTITTTGDTCNGGSGAIKVVPSSGYTAPLDYILSDGQSIIDTPLSAYTFYNVEEGGYTLQVVDGAGCSVSETINITGTTGVNVVITVTPGSYTSPDVLSATTLSGVAPFTYLWNDGSTGSTISAETEGTYSVVVTDSNGCQDSAQYIVQGIKTVVSSFPIVEICSDDFSTTTMTKKGFYDLLNEGYLELIDDLGVSGCTLNSAIFNYDISYDGQVATGSFYTGYTLSDVPSDFVWAELLEDVISLFVGIQGVEVDPIMNSVKITGDCATNEFVDIEVLIEYDLDCSYVPSSPTPTPTNTATPTPTVSVTPSVSITPTSTPAVTETVTPTPSVTSSITPTNTPSVSVSDTPGVSQTPTPTVSVTQTETSTPTPTSTITPTVTNSQTPGSSQTPTPSNTPTNSVTPTVSDTPGSSQTPTPTATQTPTLTQTNTPTQTVTVTPSISDTPSVTPTNTPSVSVSNTPGVSQTPTPTVTPTISETSTPTPTPTSSVTPSVSNTPGSTQTPTPTNTSTPTSSPTVTNTPSSTVTVTPSISETSTLTPTPTNTVTPTISETSTPTPTPTISETSTPTPTVTPSISETSTPTPTPSISETSTPTPTVTPSISETSTPTPTVTPTSSPLPASFTVYVSSTLSDDDCDKFTATITKNGSTVVTITKNSNAFPVLSTNNFQATTADSIVVSVQNATPTGAGCGSATTTDAIETGHIVNGNYVIRDTAQGNSATASYTFSPNNSTENSIIVRFPWTS